METPKRKTSGCRSPRLCTTSIRDEPHSSCRSATKLEVYFLRFFVLKMPKVKLFSLTKCSNSLFFRSRLFAFAPISNFLPDISTLNQFNYVFGRIWQIRWGVIEKEGSHGFRNVYSQDISVSTERLCGLLLRRRGWNRSTTESLAKIIAYDFGQRLRLCLRSGSLTNGSLFHWPPASCFKVGPCALDT